MRKVGNQAGSGWSSVHVGDKEMPVYFSRPPGARIRGVVILLQEFFGVTEQFKRLASFVAQEGYLALVPDLFYLDGRHFTCGYDEILRGLQRSRRLGEADFLRDMEALLGDIEHHQGPGTPVAAMGFSHGGGLAYLLATQVRLAGAISFYGGGIVEGPIEKTARIRCPLLLFFGGRDSHIPAHQIEQIRRALSAAQKPFEAIVYPEADHGFFCEDRKAYCPDAAQDAWKESIAVLDRVMGRSDGS